MARQENNSGVCSCVHPCGGDIGRAGESIHEGKGRATGEKDEDMKQSSDGKEEGKEWEEQGTKDLSGEQEKGPLFSDG